MSDIPGHLYDVSLAKLEALQRLRDAVENDALMREYGSITIPAAVMLPAYRAALLKAMEARTHSVRWFLDLPLEKFTDLDEDIRAGVNERFWELL